MPNVTATAAVYRVLASAAGDPDRLQHQIGHHMTTTEGTLAAGVIFLLLAAAAIAGVCRLLSHLLSD